VDGYKVTDEGGGIIRVDAETRLMRKPMAEAICHEVEEVAAGYGGSFKILMNLGAISKGTPGAGLYTLREMKKYDLAALALYRANGFMRAMAGVVLGLARFENFALFTDEGEAMEWLKNPTPSPAPEAGRLRQAAPSLALMGGGLAATWLGLRRLRQAAATLALLGSGLAASYLGADRLGLVRLLPTRRDGAPES
jgi:hypothetical protein